MKRNPPWYVVRLIVAAFARPKTEACLAQFGLVIDISSRAAHAPLQKGLQTILGGCKASS